MSSARAAGPSVRGRLLRPLLWSWLIGVIASVVGAYFVARTSVEQAFDRGLQDEATALAAKVNWSDRGPLLDLSRQTMELLTWDRDDRNSFVMVDSEGNPLAGDATVPVPPQQILYGSFEQPRLFDHRLDGEAVRGAAFSVTSPMLDRRVSIIVIETKKKRIRVMRDVQISIVLPAVLMGALTFVLINWGIRRGLQPLNDVAAEVAHRDSRDWRPLPLQSVPAEAVPLIERINMLLADMEQALALQRRFVADAAHQLRTPVAGIRVLAQALSHELHAVSHHAELTSRLGNSGGSEPKVGTVVTQNQAVSTASLELLAQLSRSTDRMSRLIGQLLSLARSETALASQPDLEEVELKSLLHELAEPFALQALSQGKNFILELPASPVLVRSHSIWLGEVLNNLLDNANRYGGKNIQLHLLAAGPGAQIQVEDDGAGVAPEHLERMFQPFWRGQRADMRNDDGTGLGLTIAWEVLNRLGGRLSVITRPDVPGLRFTIDLPA